jgi:hypothetical protein
VLKLSHVFGVAAAFLAAGPLGISMAGGLLSGRGADGAFVIMACSIS